MSGLVLKNIAKKFDDTVVIKDISLELIDGEFLVLLGPSGCGKSTTLRIIAGLESSDGGEIYIGSNRVDHLRPKDRNIAMVFQNYSLYPHMTVKQNLAFPLKVAGVKKTEIEKRVNETAELIGLMDRMESRPGQLSGGQRQRVALGRAVIRKPSIFLLDEPLSNLDADLRGRMRGEIVALQKRMQCTTVYVTHDQSEALTMADRVAVMNNGLIEQISSPQELYKNPSTRFVAEFVGQPKINMVEATVKDNLIRPFGIRCRPEIGCVELLVGIRPEVISIDPGGQFSGIVEQCQYLGDSFQIALRFKSDLLIISQCRSALDIGTEAKFSIDRQNLLYFNKENGKRIVI